MTKIETAKVKEFKTFDQQIDILEERGLIIDDHNLAKKVLENVNYYRFTAYLLSYKSGDENYKEGTLFQEIYSVYSFDKELRNLLSNILEEIEISFRTYIAYTLGKNYGPCGYKEADNFVNKGIHDTFIEYLKPLIGFNSKKPFIRHHHIKYGGEIPIWVATEVMSFGTLSKLYSNMKDDDIKYIKSKFCNLPNRLLKGWLESLTHIRNQCAHFGRIYNYNFPTITIRKEYKEYKLDNRKIFAYIIAIKYLIDDDKIWRNFFINLNTLIVKYEEYIDLELLGFPNNWFNILQKRD